MAGLPQGYADDIAVETGLKNYERWTDGEYILDVKEVVYDTVKVETGKEPAGIFRMCVVESKPNPNGQPAGVVPLAPGTDIDYFCQDYGKPKIMFKKKVKGWVEGLTGIDKSADPKEVAKTTDAIFDPKIQLARGMRIRGVTYHFETGAGADGIGLNWYPVPGENHPHSESVKARRAKFDAEAKAAVDGKPVTTPANGAPANGAPANGSSMAPANAGLPPTPSDDLPPTPVEDPFAGLIQNKDRPELWFKKGWSRWYKREEIVAGKGGL